jgi:outer membrane protein insertion porin family
MNKFLFAILFSIISVAALAQGPGRNISRPSSTSDTLAINYNQPREFIIGGVTVTGTTHLDKDILIQISKLNVGDKIILPGEANANVIKDLYAQQLFDDVALNITRISLDSIFLEIQVSEHPRLSRMRLLGISKGKAEDVQKS